MERPISTHSGMWRKSRRSARSAAASSRLQESATGVGPKPRRSGATTRKRSFSIASCGAHIAWFKGKAWTRRTAGPVPTSTWLSFIRTVLLFAVLVFDGNCFSDLSYGHSGIVQFLGVERDVLAHGTA